MTRKERLELRRMLKDTHTYQRIRAACRYAAADINLDEHALVIAREVMKARTWKDTPQ